MSAVDSDLPEFLRAIGDTLRATSVQFVRRGGRAALTRHDCRDAGTQQAGTQQAEFLASLGRDWLLSRGAGDVDTVVLADGWWIAMAAVGAPSLPLDGVLLITRDSASSYSNAEREQLSLAARLLSSLIGTAPLGSGSEWRTSTHRAGAGLHALDEGPEYRSESGRLSAYAVRVDGLPLVADVLGSIVSDKVIEVMRQRIQDWAGPTHEVIQLAGADFLTLRVDSTDDVSARQDAERLRQLLIRPFELCGHRIGRSVSIGLATEAGRSQSPPVLLASAFAAMREAEGTGGNKVLVYGQEYARRADELRLELELQDATQHRAFRLLYQPEFDLQTGELLAVEALLRWQHPDRGLLVPDDFIAIAEASHSIGEIGEWVVQEAFGQLARWHLQFPDLNLKLRLNVAAAQFTDGGLSDLFALELARHGLRGEQICVEVTERSMPANLSTVAAALTTLGKIGVTSAIDDFGTGQSSFTQLLELPVDTIKIDRSFVSYLASDARCREVVSAILTLAHGLGLDVVAEGVESHEAAAVLLRLGCTRAQGNLLGAAMPAERISGLMQASVDRGG